MKKLLFAIAALFFCNAVCAQYITPENDFGPKELKCTEEAIAIRIAIKPGWQLNSFRFGYAGFTAGAPASTSLKNHPVGELVAAPLKLIIYENTFNRQYDYPDQILLFSKRIANPLAQTIPFPNEQFVKGPFDFLHTTSFFFLPPLQPAALAVLSL